MAYISPSTVTTGDLITAAEWNQDIVANEQASAPDMFTDKGDLFVGTAVVTLPAAFSAAPLVLATFQSAAAVAGTTVWAAAGTTSITVRVNRTGTTGDVSVGVAWLAIGPA